MQAYNLCILLAALSVFFLMTSTVALGEPGQIIQGCPSTPNCVSSSSYADDDHHVLPFRIQVPVVASWAALKKTLLAETGVSILEDSGTTIRAEVTSKVFRFVDDLEFRLEPEKRLIQVRSASRVGYWDFGVNRRRMEALRNKLAQQGVIG